MCSSAYEALLDFRRPLFSGIRRSSLHELRDLSAHLLDLAIDLDEVLVKDVLLVLL